MMNDLRKIQPPVYPVEKVRIPEARSLVLSNGIPVHVIEAGTEEIMRIEFVFRAGQIKEFIPLLATTCNMMLSEGSQKYTSEELNRTLDFYGIFLNQSVDKDFASIILYCLSKHIEKVLELSQEILFHPAFHEHELELLMKKRVRWYLVNREKVQNLAMDQFFESVFGKAHPYGYQVKEKDFENVSQPMLNEFHSAFYRPENLTIIISGKIHEKTDELLESYFGHQKTPEVKVREALKLTENGALKKMSINKPGTVQTAIRIGSATINKRHPDYPGLKVLDAILGGYFGSRLMKNIREEKGYTYGIHSSLTSLDLSGYKVISTEVGRKNAGKAVDEIYKEIRVLQTIPVSEDEMAVVRNYMTGEMVRMFDGPFALAESFRATWEFGLGTSYYNNLGEKIISIQPEEIIELARKYYNIDDLYEIRAGAE